MAGLYQITVSDWTGSLDLADMVTYHGPSEAGITWTDDGASYTTLITAGDDDSRIDAEALVRGYFERAANAERLGKTSTVDMTFGGSRVGSWELRGGAIALTNKWNAAQAEYAIVFRFAGDGRSAGRTVFGDTVAGATARFLARGLRGDLPNLVHLDYVDDPAADSPVTRLHFCRTPAGMSLADAADYTPWVNAVALAGTGISAPTDADSYGGSYVEAAVGGANWHEIARITQPSGDWQQGTFDGFLRACGTGTPIDPPASLTATVDPATFSTTPTTNEAATTPAAAGIAVSASITGAASTTLSRAGATAGGTLLIVAVTNSTSAWTVTPSGNDGSGNPLTFTPILAVLDATYLRGWIVRNASGTTPITMTAAGGFSGAPITTIHMIELLHLGTNPRITGGDYTFVATKPSLSVTTTDTADQVVVLMGVARGGVVTTYGGALTPQGNGSAWRQVDGIDQSVSANLFITGGDWTGFILSLSVPTTTTTSSSGATYDEPTPGSLAPGDYVARVQAIDAARYRSNATASATATAARRDAMTWSWPTTVNAVGYALTISYAGRFYEVITTGISYTLTTLDGLGNVAALPATAGALAPPPVFRVLAGTVGDSVRRVLGDFVTDGTGVFRLYRAFGRALLPPVAPMLASWQTWNMVVYVRSANGANITARVDAAWLPPSETYAMVEVAGGTLSAPATWHVEAHRSGRDIIGWLGDGSRLRGFGVPLLPPPVAAGYLAFETADGHTFDSGGTLTVKTTALQRTEGTA